MDNKRNIDEILRDKLSNFEMEPPAKIWQGVSQNLVHEKSFLGKLLASKHGFLSPSFLSSFTLVISLSFLATDNNIKIQYAKQSALTNPSIIQTDKQISYSNQSATKTPIDTPSILPSIINKKSESPIIKENPKSVSSKNMKEFPEFPVLPDTKTPNTEPLAVTKEIKKPLVSNDTILSDSIKKNDLPKEIPPVRPATLKKQNKHFSLLLSFCPLYSAEKLEGKNPDNTYLSILRQGSESPSFSYSLGIEPYYSINNFFIQSGINFTSINTKANYNFSYFKFDSITETRLDSFWVFDSLGPGYWRYDTFEYTVKDTLNKTFISSNKINYSFIEIPLMLGYSFNSEKAVFRLSSGISLGIPISASGRILSSTDSFAEIDFKKNSLPFTSFPKFFLFQMSYDYRLSENISILIGSKLKISLNSIFSKNYPITQEYLNFGFGTGLRYKF